MELVNAKARPREERYPLKSIPGGWVFVKRFNHGERIERLGKVLVMAVSDGEDENEESSPEARMDHRAARLHDFAKAILDHNLSNGEGGPKYNFKKPDDVFDIDGEIGDEIDDIIQRHQEVIPEVELPKSEENSTDITPVPSEADPDHSQSLAASQA